MIKKLLALFLCFFLLTSGVFANPIAGTVQLKPASFTAGFFAFGTVETANIEKTLKDAPKTALFDFLKFNTTNINFNHIFKTALYDLIRARWYNPASGRFASIDPYPGDPMSPVSLHRYLYANTSPVNYTDPSGKFALVMVMMDVVSASSILSMMEPQIAQGVNLGIGEDLFYKPGFALRNYAMSALTTPLLTRQQNDLATDMYYQGNQLISLGSQGIAAFDKVIQVVQLGLGVKNFASSFQYVSETCTTIQVDKYELFMKISSRVEENIKDVGMKLRAFNVVQMKTLVSETTEVAVDIVTAEGLFFDILHEIEK
jgi:RHS repeat-associated protein